MRRYWFLFPIALALLLAPFLLVRSQTAILALAHWSVVTFSDLELQIENPSVRLDKGHISADEIHLKPAGHPGPALFSVIGLEASTSLSDLLTGRLRETLVSATQVLIYVSENDGARDPEPGSWIQLTTWLPSQLYIGQVHLITAAEKTWIFPLRELQGRRLDAKTFRARALADYDGEPLEVDLDLLGTHRDGQVQSLALKAGFVAPQSDSRVTLEGVLEGRDETFRYEFDAKAQYNDIGEFVRGLDSDTILSGRMALEASMVGDTRQFTLSGVNMLLDNMPAYGFEAAGELHWERGGASRLDLIAAGEMSDLGHLVNWIDLDVAALGRARASVSLTGSLDQPVMDSFILVTESDQGLSVNVSGRVALMKPGPEKSIAGEETRDEIRVDVHAPSVKALEPWVGKQAFDPGPWRASWVIRGSRDSLRLENIVLETGTEQTFLARAEGEVSELPNSNDLRPEMISGIALSLQARTSNSAHLAELTGLAIPPDHSVRGQLDISGSGSELNFSNGMVTATSSDLEAVIRDVAGVYHPGDDSLPVSDLSAAIEIAISDTGILSRYVDLETPILGPAALQARVKQSDSRFALEPVEIRIDGDYLKMSAVGTVGDLRQLSGVRLHNRVARLDIAQLLAFTLDEFQYDGELGNLQGTFDFGDRDGRWQLSGLQMETADSEGALPLGISARGAVNDLAGFTTADLEAELTIRETTLVEALTGLRARPLTASVTIGSTPDRVSIGARGRAGETSLETDVHIEYSESGIAALGARLYSPHLHLADLGLQVSDDAKDDYAPGAEIETNAKSGLENLLDRSPRFATDIQVRVDGITGRNTNVESLDIHVTGQDNRYTLREFSLAYDAGSAEIRGLIDLNQSPPFASLAGEALAIPLSALSQDLGARSDIRGTLTARGGIAASGTDLPSLAGSLSGSLAVALEDTVIRGAAYDVLATDLLAWIYSGAALETSTHLDCTMARFEIKDGVARTDSLYIESERMIATGKGMFDLARGKMDVTFTPRSRSRSFQIPSEVRLKGAMSDPRVTISPISAAADASAQALLLIPKLALRLFGAGGGRSDKGIQPCLASLQ